MIDFFTRSADEGVELPAWRDRTEVWFHLAWIMKAFYELSPSRQYIAAGMGGMVEGFIPITEIKAYCEFIQLDDPDDRADFLELLQAIDKTYLAELKARREANSDKTKPKGS